MIEKIYLKDIAGYDDEKNEAKKIIEILKNYEKYEAIGAYVPKGLILSGHPGVGKTMLATAIANESGVPFFECNPTQSDDYEERIEEIFKEAKQQAPSIIFIDEIDSIVKFGSFESDATRGITQLLLRHLDGVDSSNGVLTIVTTIDKSFLPSSLLRSGRMDKNIDFDLPDLKEREAILNLYISKSKVLHDIDAHILATRTNNFTGADIKALINETIISYDINKVNEIDTTDIANMIPVIRYRNIRHSDDSIDDTTIYHEIGHFVCEYKISGKCGSISLEKFGLIQGFMEIMDEDSKQKGEAVTKNNLQNKIITLLGGMAAEEVIIGDISNGSANDIKKAAIYIESLINVGAFGFEAITPKTSPFEDSNKISENKLRTIENIETKILSEAYEKAKQIISENLPLVDALYKEVKEKTKLTELETKEIVDNFERREA